MATYHPPNSGRGGEGVINEYNKRCVVDKIAPASVSLFHWITKSLIFGNLAIFLTVTDDEIVDLSAGSLDRRESQL